MNDLAFFGTETAGAVHPEAQEQALLLLGDFDMLNMCGRLRCPVMISAGLKDTVCLPETICAVYNRLTVPKEICFRSMDMPSAGIIFASVWNLSGGRDLIRTRKAGEKKVDAGKSAMVIYDIEWKGF